MREAAETPASGSVSGFRAQALAIAAHLEVRLARYADAMARAEQALAAASPDDRTARYLATSVRATAAMYTDAFPRPHASTSRRWHSRERAPSPRRRVHARQPGAGAQAHGHYDESLRLSLEALSQHRRNRDAAAVALCLSNLGSLTMFLGKDDMASAYLDEARELSERAGLVSTRAFVLANLSVLTKKADDDARARVHAERALEVARRRACGSSRAGSSAARATRDPCR